MIDKEFVPNEEALALKELGFDEPCLKFYAKGKLILALDAEEGDTNNKLNWYNPLYISAPTFSQAFRWFREKYGISTYVSPLEDGSGFYHMIYTNINVPYSNRICSLPEKWQKHEEAELACLRKLIEIVKEKQNENR